MNEQLPSYRSSEDDVHVREPSRRGRYDRSKGHSYSHVSSSDLEASTAPVPKREGTKPLRDGFTTLFRVLASKQWDMTATFNDMADAAAAFLRLAAILMVIVGVVTLVVLIICVGIHFARQLLSASFNGFGF